jgi:hypothetical protein
MENRFSLTERRRRSQRGLKTRRKRHWEDTSSFHPNSTGSSVPVAAAVHSSDLFARARARPHLLLRSPFPSACLLVINGAAEEGNLRLAGVNGRGTHAGFCGVGGGTRPVPAAGSPLTSASWALSPARPLKLGLPSCCCFFIAVRSPPPLLDILPFRQEALGIALRHSFDISFH